jgi:hypothetical protein
VNTIACSAASESRGLRAIGALAAVINGSSVVKALADAQAVRNDHHTTRGPRSGAE